MNKLSFVLFLALCFSRLQGQTNEPYEFSAYKKQAATPVKSQDQTGTCWAFSTASFLESEALRLGKEETNLSEMFVVRNIYRLKCENYVRRQGTAQFGEGGLAHDMLFAVKKFGIIPESVYPGRKDPSRPLNHSQLEKSLKEKCVAFAQQGKEGKLDPKWIAEIDALLDAEFGPVPATFSYNNVVYNPLSFRDYLNIRPDDYVTITSFTHHPFWEKFILEIPDNWSNGEFYNLPLDDMMRAAAAALDKGYTLEWDTDVSNMGFSANNGIAIVPQTPWQDKSASARATAFKMWEPEQKISQEYRQKLFDSQETMDDHLMHIVGVVNEKHAGRFFVVKNSWGEISDFKGYVNTSDAYMRLNTISYTIPKIALPADIRQKLGIEVEDNQSGKDSGAAPETKNNEKADEKPAKPAKKAPAPSVQYRQPKKPFTANNPKE